MTNKYQEIDTLYLSENMHDHLVFTWETDYPINTNTFVMSEFLDYYLEDGYLVEFLDGTYAEISEPSGDRWELHASGNGDFYNHKVEWFRV